MNKRIVTDTVEGDIRYNIDEQPLSVVTEYFKELSEKYPKGRLSIDVFYDYDSPGVGIEVHQDREETDYEYEARLDRMKRMKEHRKQQYEQLKKEFG